MATRDETSIANERHCDEYGLSKKYWDGDTRGRADFARSKAATGPLVLGVAIDHW
jgi:hypothetical protein